MTPLRLLVLASASTDDRVNWAGSGAYRIVGKREVQTEELRCQVRDLLQRMSRDRSDSYDAYVDAIDRMQEGDRSGATSHLLRAGKIAESAGLLEQARAWYGVALDVAGAIRGRQSEVETLLALGRVTLRLGRFQDAARHFQRAVALAESERNDVGAADACAGLGTIALEQAPAAAGARPWFERGLAFAQLAGDERRVAALRLHLGEAAFRGGEWVAAGDNLRDAHRLFVPLADTSGMARALALQAAVHAGVGEASQALATYREAIACVLNGDREPALEVSLRIDFAKVLLAADRYTEAHEELRIAEQLAITHSLIHDLIRIYTHMGSARGSQGDEIGFVFFEQAIELMRLLDHSQVEEAQVCLEYGIFERRLERPEESRAYLDRARELFESVGASGGLARAEAELGRVSA